MGVPAEEALVFNVVWTGTCFGDGLRYFVSSQLAQTRARFRFVANGCPPEQVEMLQAYRERHRDRVVEVLDVSDVMVAHGVALDRVRAIRDDGEFFSLIDPDIKASGPFARDLVAALDDCDVVTSGREVWLDDNRVPDGHPGVAGEYVYDRNGFVFGCPHLAIYRRSVLDATAARWGVGLESAGPELRSDTKARLVAMGHDYVVYDTGKIVNVLLQGDGHRLAHRDRPELLHIGGLSHFLSPSHYLVDEHGEEVPEWTRHANMSDRHLVARYTALVLRACVAGDPAPPVPPGQEPAMDAKLRLVRDEVVDLIDRHGDGGASEPPPAPAGPSSAAAGRLLPQFRRLLRR